MSNRDRLASAVKNLEQFSDELDAKNTAPTGEDIANLKARMEEIKSLREAVEGDAALKGDLADAKSFLRSLGSDTPKVESEKVVIKSESGLALPKAGETFGDLFTKSPAYTLSLIHI